MIEFRLLLSSRYYTAISKDQETSFGITNFFIEYTRLGSRC